MRIVAFVAMSLLSQLSLGQYTVAFPSGDYSPQYSDSGGNIEGFLPELLRLFSSETGHDLALRALPIKRYVALFQKGQVDFVLPSNPDWIDNKHGNVKFSGEIMKSRSGFIRRIESRGHVVKGVATVQGYTLPNIDDNQKHEGYLESFTINTEASLEMLKRRYVDAVYAHLDIAKAWVQKNHYEGEFYFEESLAYDNYSYHLSTIRHNQIIFEFNQWLSKNKARVLELMNKYHVGSKSLVD